MFKKKTKEILTWYTTCGLFPIRIKKGTLLPATRYKLWAWDGPVGEGSMGPHYVRVTGVAKRADVENPFVVANELVCYHLAKAILLPVPPGFIVAHGGSPCYVSLDFNLSGSSLPPVNPELVAEEAPDAAAGVVMFDMWVVNVDRHDLNLHYDLTQKKIEIFDHGHAFFNGSSIEEAKEALRNLNNDVGIVNHCLARELRNLMFIKKWVDRIMAVPDFYITEVIKAATEVGLPASEGEFCKNFLAQRREVLNDLVRKNRNTFPKVQPMLWDDF